MQVDFYQLSRDPIKAVVPLLAAKACEGGARLLVVSNVPEQRAALSQALWDREKTFLANGMAEEPNAERQPILLSENCEPVNGAAMVLIADGVWRAEAASFARAILLFGAGRTNDARLLWRELAGSGHELRIFKQNESGGWREGA